jgi:hypothetical protein
MIFPEKFGEENFFVYCNSPKARPTLQSFRLDNDGEDRLIAFINELKAKNVRTWKKLVDNWPDPSKGRQVEEPIEPVPIVVLDSFARFYPGTANENDAQAMTAVMDAANSVAVATGAIVLCLHHVSQAQHGANMEDIDPRTYGRGSTALQAAARVNLTLASVKDTDGQVVGLKYLSNSQPPSPPMFFRVRPEGAPREKGICFFELMSKEEVAKIKEDVKATKQSQLPGSQEIEQELRAMGKVAEINKSALKEAIATLTGMNPGSKKVREHANQILEEMLADGKLEPNEKKKGYPVYRLT